MNTTTRIPSPETEMVDTIPSANLPDVRRDTPVVPERAAAPPILPHKELVGNGSVVGAIAAVMEELKEGVEKGGKNTFHDYRYARMQDILLKVTPLLGKHGLVIWQTEHDRQMFDNGAVIAIQYRFTIAHKSGEVWPEHPLQTGMSYCRFVGGKSAGKFDDKSLNKCHTAARKYFLMSLFQIPTEDEHDADNEQARTSSNSPVPGPGGHMPPHRIDPIKGETPKTWSTKYRNAIQAAQSDAELVEWDNVNDDLLGMLQEQAEDIYTEVMKKFEGLRRSFAPSQSFVHYEQGQPAKTEQTAATAAPSEPTPLVRPAGCPDADKEPDAFVAWAEKRMDGLDNADDLSNIWETEITPASDGLFKPDCDSLKKYYDMRMAKIGA